MKLQSIKLQTINRAGSRTMLIAMPLLAGCPLGIAGRVESDVPCITQSWGEDVLTFVMRNESADGGRILFTTQTAEQGIEDSQNGERNYSPHGPVFAYMESTRSLSEVDSETWDVATGNFERFNHGDTSDKFDLFLPGGSAGFYYMDLRATVSGGLPRSIINANYESTIVAVLSTSGTARIPLISPGGANGQYFHQLFSEETGKPTGIVVRLGLGNGTDFISPGAAWTADNRYVVYRWGDTVCFAPGISNAP